MGFFFKIYLTYIVDKKLFKKILKIYLAHSSTANIDFSNDFLIIFLITKTKDRAGNCLKSLKAFKIPFV